eukprot:scaffold18597_cov63-Phaeocystis_antarctica.AAC.7
MAPASMLAFSLLSARLGLPACSPKSEKPPSALPQSGCAPVGPLKSSLGCSLTGTDCDAAAGRAAKLGWLHDDDASGGEAVGRIHVPSGRGGERPHVLRVLTQAVCGRAVTAEHHKVQRPAGGGAAGAHVEGLGEAADVRLEVEHVERLAARAAARPLLDCSDQLRQREGARTRGAQRVVDGGERAVGAQLGGPVADGAVLAPPAEALHHDRGEQPLLRRELHGVHHGRAHALQRRERHAVGSGHVRRV